MIGEGVGGGGGGSMNTYIHEFFFLRLKDRRLRSSNGKQPLPIKPYCIRFYASVGQPFSKQLYLTTATLYVFSTDVLQKNEENNESITELLFQSPSTYMA